MPEAMLDVLSENTITLKSFRLHIARLITFIAALQILNMSFFVQDFQQLATGSSSISDNNVINSVVEYVSEVLLQKVNAVPEHNNNADKDLQANKHFGVKMVKHEQQTFSTTAFTNTLHHKYPFIDPYSYHFFSEINPPPPKA